MLVGGGRGVGRGEEGKEEGKEEKEGVLKNRPFQILRRSRVVNSWPEQR